MKALNDLTGQIRETQGGPIDSGGFSAVRLAHWQPAHLRRPVPVAVKTLRVSGNVNRDAIEQKLMKRLHREARVWMKLSHESIAPFLGVVTEDQGPGLVSLWYQRGNLPHFLSRPYHRTVNREILCYDVASGLKYLHTHEPQIIHGDLKGANVLIDPEGRACLCDFGLSVVDDGLPTGHTSSDFGGSLRFLAPELLEDSRKTTATDYVLLNSQGLFFQALLDSIPYSEYKEDSKIMRLLSDGVPPHDLNKDETRFLLVPSELLEQCWARDPNTRPTAKDLTSTFRHCLLGRHFTARHLRDSLGDSFLILHSIGGVFYRAKLSGITNDAFSASFSVLSPDAGFESIRVYLYRRVEWIWMVEDDRGKGEGELVAAPQDSTQTRLASLLSETRMATLGALPTRNNGEDDHDIGIEWDYIAPLFRTAAPTVQEKPSSSWRDYVQDIAKSVAPQGSVTRMLAGPPLTRSGGEAVNVEQTSFQRWTPSLSYVQSEGNEYMLPDNFRGLSLEQLESGPGLSASLPGGQARSPKFSRIVGFDA